MSLIKVKLTMHRCHHYARKCMGPKQKINKFLAIQPSIHSSVHSFVYTVLTSVHALIYPFILSSMPPILLPLQYRDTILCYNLHHSFKFCVAEGKQRSACRSSSSHTF